MFIWQKEFELGISSIDNQHKKLIEIGNRINDLLSLSTDGIDNFDEIIEVMGELKDYTVYHFTTEEKLLKKYNYPNFDEHKEAHDKFIADIDSVNLNSAVVNQSEFLNELLNKIVNWVFYHIITEDYMYKDFLISLGSK
ncbi:MAG: hemerythrin-like metal-binding protein [Anaerocolumna sp.]|jgi:hemerythrin|nr:hemerythrin-like metal-binding protein [Anaerocolumna sp.]